MVVHLKALITSAMAIKPSTMYILQVENIQTNEIWHTRRCFSEFSELRDKLLALLHNQDGNVLEMIYLSNQKSSNLSTYRILNRRRSSGSISLGKIPQLCYLYQDFPRKQIIKWQSKRVIDQRCLALNGFLYQTLTLVGNIKKQHQIALYFSMMTCIEKFLDYTNTIPQVQTFDRTLLPMLPISFQSSPVNSTPHADSIPDKEESNENPSVEQTKTEVPIHPIPSFHFSMISTSSSMSVLRHEPVGADTICYISSTHDVDASTTEDEEDDILAIEKYRVFSTTKSRSCVLSEHQQMQRLEVKPFTPIIHKSTQAIQRTPEQQRAWAARVEIAGLLALAKLPQTNTNQNGVVVMNRSTGFQSCSASESTTDSGKCNMDYIERQMWKLDELQAV